MLNHPALFESEAYLKLDSSMVEAINHAKTLEIDQITMFELEQMEKYVQSRGPLLEGLKVLPSVSELQNQLANPIPAINSIEDIIKLAKLTQKRFEKAEFLKSESRVDQNSSPKP